MNRRVLAIAWKRISSLGKDDSGAALVITLAVFFFIFILVASVYTVGTAVNNRIVMQNACDAAAYSAAVVQADGLSRMATVNRAMSWTYVQMVRRQMDYITYRWLKLTHKNFQEDYKAAKKWHWITPILPCDKKHKKEGTGWWCGQGSGDDHKKIRLNMHDDYVNDDDLKELLDNMSDAMGDDEDSGSSSEDDDDDVDVNDMFEIPEPDYNDAQKEFVNMLSEEGEDFDFDNDEQKMAFFTKWYEKCTGDKEPSKTVVNEFGQEVQNQQWVDWATRRATFTSDNEIDDDNYKKMSNPKCKICGKSASEGDHSKCYEKYYKSLESSTKESSTSSHSSGGKCSICNAEKSGGTHKYCSWGQGMATQIQNDKKTIEMLNMSLSAINLNMMSGMKEAARKVLEYNLPKDEDGNVQEDFFYTLNIPVGSDPYGQAENDDASLPGMFSPLYNTEEHETLFLNMADGEIADKLVDYFQNAGEGGGGFLGGLANILNGGSKAKGLDQWFIRTNPAESKIDNKTSIEPTGESFHAEGISRSYKNANRKEGDSLLGYSRGNHILHLIDGTSVGSGDLKISFMKPLIEQVLNSILNSFDDLADISPSCQNKRKVFPDMCKSVDDSVALVSQYRWASAFWFCKLYLYTFGYKWTHPYFPKFYCKPHGYGVVWVGDELGLVLGFDGKSRKDYKCCFMGADKTFTLKGYSRIYGDDKDLFNEQYVGVPARPWVLNEKYFSGDGSITVGVAQVQKNPWQRYLSWCDGYDKSSPNVSNGLFSIFNVKKGNYVWTTSAARAAYKRRSDDLSSGNLQYDVKFDTSAYPDALNLDFASEATADMKTLRVGCVCDDTENQSRLEKAWNLNTPDWEATLLPVRYSRGHSAKYESWNGDGLPVWTEASGSDGGVFELLSQKNWTGFGDNSSQAIGGSTIMDITDMNGKKLSEGGFGLLEKLKIY